MKILGIIAGVILLATTLHAQDSIPVKVRHAEPLYIDLIRDLGARKGEKEWNVGWGINLEPAVATNTAFIEYEFAPLNRLGFEVELPFSFYQNRTSQKNETTMHRNRVDGLKLATQYTFLVSPKHQLSMALGYIHELRLHSFQTMRSDREVLKGHLFNPIFIAAKRLGNHFHTLVYTGPVWETTLNQTKEFSYQLNASIHYMMPTRHFLGIELNDEQFNHHHSITVRPQIKMALNSALAVCLVAGIPTNAQENTMSFMTRIIYEPARRK